MSLEHVLRGDLDDWQGLSGNETEARLHELLKPVRQVRQEAERTRQTQRFRVTVFEREVAPRLIEAWFLYGEQHAMLLEYDDPPVVHLEDTLDQYGPPDAILEDKRYYAGGMVKEYVYAHRGITLSIAEPIDDATTRVKTVIHLQLYATASVQHYVTDIGAGDALRPYPLS
jgi:hypothetical protein